MGATKVKGLRITNWLLQNSQRDVKGSIGNIVNKIRATMYGVRWFQEIYPDDHLVSYTMFNRSGVHLKLI